MHGIVNNWTLVHLRMHTLCHNKHPCTLHLWHNFTRVHLVCTWCHCQMEWQGFIWMHHQLVPDVLAACCKCLQEGMLSCNPLGC
jgi:hypothetical protein